MSRSTLTCWLVAELMLCAPAIAAGRQDKVERCLSTCDQMHERFEKSCKQQLGGGGRCEGRGRALVLDMDKQCRQACAKRKK